MILPALTAVLLFHSVYTEEAIVIGDAGSGVKIPMSISMNDGYAVTVSGQPDNAQPFYKESINLYDFDKQLEARKIEQEGVCYIKRFSGTSDQIKKLIDAATMTNSVLTASVSEEFNIPGEEIKADELEETLGARIPVFCSGYSVVWMRVNRKIRKLQARRERSSNGNKNLKPMIQNLPNDVQESMFPYGGSVFRPDTRTTRMNGQYGYDPQAGYRISGGFQTDLTRRLSLFGNGVYHQNGRYSVSIGLIYSHE